MNAHLSKYLWRFFGLFLVGYLMGMLVILFVNHHSKIPLHDIFVLALLSLFIPSHISRKFILNEGRFFDKREQKIICLKSALLGFIISMTPTFVYVTVQFSKPVHESTLRLLLTLFGVSVFYFVLLWLMISRSYSRAGKKYDQKQQYYDNAINDGQ